VVKLLRDVWEDPANDSVAMFIHGSKGWRSTLSAEARLLRTFEAESVFEAFRTHNRLMGFGEWSPPEGMEDRCYDGTEITEGGDD
jgi:hypothetical protein